MQTIQNMPNDSRVWVYQCNKKLSTTEVEEIKKMGIYFISDWSAHGASLNASFDVLYNLFIVIAVDENQALASGCSIDKSIHFMKQLEQKFNINLFDRMQVAYKNKNENEILFCSFSEFEKLANQKLVDASTIVFNNMVTTKMDFDNFWQIPLKQSWQNRVLV